MGSSLGFAVELLVAVLLAVTIGYCILVNRKLESLRSDQSELKTIIRELNAATAKAGQAIEGLRETAGSAEAAVQQKAEQAGALQKRLAEAIARGEGMLARLTVQMRTGAPAQGNAAARPQTAGRPRHSQVGLGLLNAEQRAAAAPSKDVA